VIRGEAASEYVRECDSAGIQSMPAFGVPAPTINAGKARRILS
jgi:hypothetical protein